MTTVYTAGLMMEDGTTVYAWESKENGKMQTTTSWDSYPYNDAHTAFNAAMSIKKYAVGEIKCMFVREVTF